MNYFEPFYVNKFKSFYDVYNFLETKLKKSTDEETNELHSIEELCHMTMDTAMQHVNQSFTPLKKKTLSPFLVNMQVHMDVFDERKKEDELAMFGLINYNLCLNAQTG